MTQLNDIAEIFLKIWETQSIPSGCAIDFGALTLDEAYTVQQMVIEHRVRTGRIRTLDVSCVGHPPLRLHGRHTNNSNVKSP